MVRKLESRETKIHKIKYIFTSLYYIKMERTKEMIEKRKKNRAGRLEMLENMDRIIRELKELRGNSERYTTEELIKKQKDIIENKQKEEEE